MARTVHTAASQRRAAAAKTPAGRTRTDLTLQASAVAQARAMGLNLSRLADAKIAEAIREQQARCWLQAKQPAIKTYNARVRRDGPWNKDLISF
ncbi:type II toxin-antitoxin system CcdA family antitoxin [Panacagrimonas sp.]|uniref:type II toxin-antitoxin system CcdA family antitoxin n=1 Tax=Panacagrimonas sp. TaxID=2480088 RepID=UPI003B51B54C